MSNANKFRGALHEVQPGNFRRDSRPFKEKFQEFIEKPEGFAMMMAPPIAFFFILPALGELWFAISLVIFFIGKKACKKIRLPFRVPKTANMLDLGQLNAGNNKPEQAEGISFFGNDVLTKKELWFNNSDMRTHILIFGTTGSGKTEALLSLSYNALVQGSGFIYVDGKGENSLYTKVFTLARTMGREDDVLVVNYMTGERDVFGPQEYKLSNTLNPFTSGSSGGLTEMMVSLMDGGGSGGDMWKGRAQSLISAIMMVLVYLRDKGEILLDVDKIREYLILENIIKLYKTRRDLPQHVREAVKGYLVSLPGFSESKTEQSDTVMDQHGYLQMQFTKILGSLADSYGFIYRTNLGEVDFKDVVLNRRILVVLLPALEKSKEELASLGKVIIACVKQMMGSALGSKIEGTYEEVIETKPTTSPIPFMTIFDEYGYYAVEGSAVMPAQARSLGFSMIFAGQDLPAFEKASKEEAASIVANCSIKICMRLEDPDTTYDLFAKSAGETLAPSVNTLESKSGLLGSSFVPAQNVSLDFRKRIDVSDLKDQLAGEAHILFRAGLVRAKMFYANPPRIPELRVNYFIGVEPPSYSLISAYHKKNTALYESLSNIDKLKLLEENIDLEKGNVDKLNDLYKNTYNDRSFEENIIASLMHINQDIHCQYEAALSRFATEEDQDDTVNVFSGSKKTLSKEEEQIRSFYKIDDGEDENSQLEEEEQGDVDGVFIDEKEFKNSFSEIERFAGESEENAEHLAEQAAEELKDLSKYPSDGMPSIKDPEDILNLLQEIEESINSEQD